MTRYIEQFGMSRQVGEGEMSGHPERNPHFWNWTGIMPVYCDGSNYAGVVDHPGVVHPEYNGTLYVRGRKIMQTVLDVVLHDWGLDETLEEVMLTGCSAGGTGVYFNVDWLHT